MNDLISRQAAIDAVAELASSMSVCISVEECHGMKRMQGMAVRVLDELPSAQPEIVRCKECKYFRQNYVGGVTCCDRSVVDKNGDYINRISYGWGFDDFCSHAEMRDDRDERSV